MTQTSSQVCPQCRTPIAAGEHFCPHCGHRFSTESNSSPAASPDKGVPISLPERREAPDQEEKAFWSSFTRDQIREAIKSYDDTAKQVLSVEGVLVGLYFNAFTFGKIAANDWRLLVCKLFHSMRYFFDNYLTYITVCLPKVKGFESACEALSMVSEKESQRCHYVRYL